MKISDRQEKELDCICGLCEHDCMDKDCAFNKIINAMSPEEAQKKKIKAWTLDVFRANTKKQK